MKTITAVEAFEALESSKALLIDVREQEEFDQCRINGALLVPLSNLPARIQEIDLPKDKSIIFQCLKGGRSAEAIMYLEQDYLKEHELYNLEGGIVAWAQSGLPIEK